MKMAMSVIQACRSLALSTWLLSFCFVHLLCLDFTVAEKEEWYTAFVNITYADPAGGSAELRSEKSECGRYGEQSPKQDARGQVALSASPADRYACDPGTRFNAPAPGKSWVALIPRGNCTYKDKIRHAAAQNASAVVIYNVGSSNANETITMPHAGEPRRPARSLGPCWVGGWGDGRGPFSHACQPPQPSRTLRVRTAGDKVSSHPRQAVRCAAGMARQCMPVPRSEEHLSVVPWQRKDVLLPAMHAGAPGMKS